MRIDGREGWIFEPLVRVQTGLLAYEQRECPFAVASYDYVVIIGTIEVEGVNVVAEFAGETGEHFPCYVVGFFRRRWRSSSFGGLTACRWRSSFSGLIGGR